MPIQRPRGRTIARRARARRRRASPGVFRNARDHAPSARRVRDARSTVRVVVAAGCSSGAVRAGSDGIRGARQFSRSFFRSNRATRRARGDATRRAIAPRSSARRAHRRPNERARAP
eukprot:29197-Pelagococcus_subviridis.AAC.6